MVSFSSLSLLLAVVCILSSSCAHGAVIQFNSTVIPQCQTAPGCALNDSSIYEGGILPDAGDVVYITAPSSVLLYLPVNDTFQLDSLYLSGPVSLLVEANATLSVSGNLNAAQAHITVLFSGLVYASGNVSISSATTITLYGDLFIDWNPLSDTTLSANSSIVGNPGSSFIIISRNVTFYGSLSFSLNSSFYVETYGLYVGATLDLPNFPFLGWATFENINTTFLGGFDAYYLNLVSSNVSVIGPVGTEVVFGGFSADGNSQVRLYNASVLIQYENDLFSPGFGGSGLYVISSSDVYAVLGPNPVTSTFHLLGQNNISIINFFVNASQLNFGTSESGEAPYSIFGLGNNASISGNIDFPGEISLFAETQLVLSGNISFSGPFSANTIYGPTSTTIHGSLKCQSIILAYSWYNPEYSYDQNPSVITTVNATLIAESIQILGSANLQSINTSHYFVANLTNNGTFSASETNNIILEGNYTQLDLGTFSVYDLTTTVNRTINLLVNGSAVLHGAVNYSTVDKPGKKQSYIVLEASNVNGTFFKGQYYGRDESKFTKTISYSANTVKIEIDPKTLSWLGLDWWIWLIIVGAAAVAIIVLIVVGVRHSKRSKYEAV